MLKIPLDFRISLKSGNPIPGPARNLPVNRFDLRHMRTIKIKCMEDSRQKSEWF